MKFDHAFIAFGILAGIAVGFSAGYLPFLKKAPAMLWLLGAILVFDLAAAYIRGVPIILSVGTAARLVAFCGGVSALILTGQMW
jgi:hypothetical protein